MSRKLVLTTILMAALIGMLGLSFQIHRAEASGIIYIRADGSIDPQTAPISSVDGVTYTFTDNINSDGDGIVVERSNITIDGVGYTLQGSGSGYGFYLSHIDNVTIEKININGFYMGVRLLASSHNAVYGSNLMDNKNVGLFLGFSSYNSILDNNIINNGCGDYGGDGIWIGNSSDYNTVSANAITNNGFGSSMTGGDGIEISSSFCNIISGNNLTDNRFDGINVSNSLQNDLSENNITNNGERGVELYWLSNNNTILSNFIENNSYYGISLYDSSNNTIFHNNLVDNSPWQVYFYSGSNNVWDGDYPSGGNYWSDYTGIDLSSGFYQNETSGDGIGDTAYFIDANNQDNYPLMKPYVPFENQTIYIRVDGSVDPSGAPILRKGDLYTLSGNITSNADGIIIERDNMTLEGAGYTVQGTGVTFSRGIGISGRSNLTVKNIKTEAFFWGVYIGSSFNDTFSGNNITNNDRGICLEHSSNNSVAGNNITNNWYGIYLYQSSNNSISGNNITNNGWLGIYLWFSSGNSIKGNSITNNFDGIEFDGSSSNSISGDSITNNANGIVLDSSSNYNTISENSITNNSDIGIELWNSLNNRFFHNNFINNTQQVRFAMFGYSSSWDDDYPSGGNYWSNYTGVDVKSGSYQNETGSDGIGDTPYIIDANNIDDYPLVVPTAIPEFPLFFILPLFMMVTLLAAMIYRRKHALTVNRG